MYFQNYCNKSNIYITDKDNKSDILDDMLNELDVKEDIKAEIRKSILYREQLMSTGIGLGVAIPHARIENIHSINISVSVLKNDCIDYESMDNEPVRVIFMIIIPQNMHGEYIKILSAIVSQTKNENLVDDLLKCSTIDDIYTRLEQI